MVTDPSSGIRFDIYERVHLPEDAPAIEELEEIELVPHMQAQKQAEQTVLKGHLLLTGLYQSSDRGQSSEKLEHWIPVEITLPPDRVQRDDELAVEIDNFDVDLLSTRSLNVTGVLALRGIHASQAHQPIWRDDSFTVVHQVQSEERLQEEQASMQAVQHDREQTDAGASSAEEGSGLPQSSDDFVRENDPQQGEQTEDLLLVESSDNGAAATGWGDLTANAAQQSLEQSIDDEEQTENAPAKKELKIAFGVKSPQADTVSPGVELLSKMGAGKSIAALSASGIHGAADRQADISAHELLQSQQLSQQQSQQLLQQQTQLQSHQLIQQQAQLQSEQESQLQLQPQSEQASTGDELEWTRLFLSAETDADPFCKLRMCIVQREDTLEDIAARYNLEPRELQLHNSLEDPNLSEGQVLYIPQ